MENLKIAPGHTLICVDPTGWEEMKAGMLLEVETVSESAFKVSNPLIGNVTVLNEHGGDFIRIDYVEVTARWGHGPGGSEYLCLTSSLDEPFDGEFVEEEIAPSILHLDGLMDRMSFRGISIKTIPRRTYVENKANRAIDQNEWDFDISRDGDRVSVSMSVLDGLRGSPYSERRIVCNVMMGYLRRQD